MLGGFLGGIVEYIVAVETVLIAFIGGYFMLQGKRRERQSKADKEESAKRQAIVEKRAEMRKQESLMTMELMYATMSLGIATANAVKNDKTNGTMDSALRCAEMANFDYDKFVRTTAAEIITDS
jgi:hypothetical protein